MAKLQILLCGLQFARGIERTNSYGDFDRVNILESETVRESDIVDRGLTLDEILVYTLATLTLTIFFVYILFVLFNSWCKKADENKKDEASTAGQS